MMGLKDMPDIYSIAANLRVKVYELVSQINSTDKSDRPSKRSRVSDQWTNLAAVIGDSADRADILIEIEVLRTENEQLKAKAASSSSTNISLEKQLGVLSAEIQESKQECESLRRENEKLSREFGSFGKYLKYCQKHADILNGNHEKLQKALYRSKTEQSSAQTSIDLLSDSLDLKTEELAKILPKLENFQKVLASQQSKIADLETENFSSVAKIEFLQSRDRNFSDSIKEIQSFRAQDEILLLDKVASLEETLRLSKVRERERVTELEKSRSDLAEIYQRAVIFTERQDADEEKSCPRHESFIDDIVIDRSDLPDTSHRKRPVSPSKQELLSADTTNTKCNSCNQEMFGITVRCYIIDNLMRQY